ncbi:MAG TPA: catecholate siderophore receptor Fiu [Steroidobacteraceae bacterium]|nr:catecholate siderophore receptor Fiu [Steroidobacteraceae bacterium]
MSIKSRKRPVVRSANYGDSRALGLMLALPGLALGAQSQAAEGAEGRERVLPGVVVTGEMEDGYRAESSSPKATQTLLDTPQTVTVITKELLDDQGVGSLAEALRNTPGITFTLGENGNTTAGDSISMRGFDTSGSIFLDGIRDLGAIARDTFNVEQIEVVKGSSGADIGRGSPTGYINQSTKQPTLQDMASTSLALGTDNRVRFEGDVNQALGALAGSAVRLNLMYDGGDKPGRDVADNRRWGIAPALALGLGGSTRAYFNYLFMKQINTPDGGLPTIGLEDYNYVSNVSVTNPTQEQAENLTDFNSNVTQMVADADLGPVDRRNFYGSRNDFEHVRANMFTAIFEHDLTARTTLRNTSRYGRYTLRREITGINTLGNLYFGTAAQAAAGTAILNPDSSTWTISRSHQRRDEVNELMTNQTSLRTSLSMGGIEHSMSMGAEFIYERHQLYPSVASGTQSAADIYNPGTADSFTSFARSGASSQGKTLTAAVYAFDNLALSEKWSVSLGLRFDRYRIDSSVIPAPAATPAASSYFEDSGSLFTGKVGVVFKPVEYGTIYAAYANSEQPPGGQPQSAGTNPNFALGGNAATNNPNVDPQEARNVEVGTKWELFESRLSLSAAAFDTRNRNDVIGTQDPVTGEYPQSGERKVQGVELAVAGSITPDWLVSAGLASMKTKVVEGTANNTGAQLQFSPKLTFSSWTTYTLPMGLKIGGGARYVDSSFRNGNATQASVSNLAKSPSYWVMDLMAGYDVNERISLQLNVQNFTDKFYLASLNNGGSRYTLGTPRTFLLTGRVEF